MEEGIHSFILRKFAFSHKWTILATKTLKETSLKHVEYFFQSETSLLEKIEKKQAIVSELFVGWCEHSTIKGSNGNGINYLVWPIMENRISVRTRNQSGDIHSHLPHLGTKTQRLYLLSTLCWHVITQKDDTRRMVNNEMFECVR